MGRVLRIQVNGILSDPPAPVSIERLAGVGIHIKAWGVATGHVETYPVATLEDQRRRIHFDRKLVRVSRLEQFRFAETIVVSRANDAVADIEIDARRKICVGRVDINELRGEVGVGRVRGSPQLY